MELSLYIMDVDEFENDQDLYENRQAKLAEYQNVYKVLKQLPSTKENLMNLRKQSMLKSYVTSQDGSFASNRPTEEAKSPGFCSINPRQIIEFEKRKYEYEIAQNNNRSPSNYSGSVMDINPNNVSSPYLKESSIFEEYFKNAERKSEQAKLKRERRLHNCNQVGDYTIVKAHEPKKSVTIHRNKGDTDLVLKETIDYIEGVEEFSPSDYSQEETKFTPVFSETDQEQTYIQDGILKDIIETRSSKIATTPAYENPEEEGHCSTDLDKIESSEQRSNNNLNSLVTKVTSNLPFRAQMKAECTPEMMGHEQGQNNAEEVKQPAICSNKKGAMKERI